MGRWRRTKADPSVSLASLVDAVVDHTSLRSKAHRQTSGTWEHTPGTAMHPPGAEAGTQREVGRRGKNGKAGRMEEGRAEQRAQAAQNAQHSMAHSTQQARPRTAGQGLLPLSRPLEPGAPRLPPHLRFSCFKDKGLMTWREVLAQGPRLRGWATLFPCCRWTFQCVLASCSALSVFPIASSKPSGARD